MRKISLYILMAAALALAACGNGSSVPILTIGGPQPPINDPDTGVFNPPNPGGSGAAGNTAGGQAGNPGGAGGAPSTNQGNSSGGPAGGGPGGGPGGGAAGGQPVPEPGTLLLFGSGIAGLGASLLRRKRRDLRPTDAN